MREAHNGDDLILKCFPIKQKDYQNCGIFVENADKIIGNWSKEIDELIPEKYRINYSNNLLFTLYQYDF